jgi:hypothetical protein
MHITKSTYILIVLFFINYSFQVFAQDCSALIQDAPTHTIYFSKNSSDGEVGIYGMDSSGSLLGECGFTLGANSYPSFSFFEYDLYAAGTQGFTVGVLNSDSYGLELLDENISTLGTTFYSTYAIEVLDGYMLYNQGGQLFIHDPFEADIMLSDFTFDIKGITGYVSEIDSSLNMFVTTGNHIYKISYDPAIGLSSLAQTLVYTGTNLGAIEWLDAKLYVVEDVMMLRRMEDNGNNSTLIYSHVEGLVSGILDITVSKEDEVIFFSTRTQYTPSGSTWDISIKKLDTSESVVDIVAKDQDSPNYYYESFDAIEVNLSNPSSLSVSATPKMNSYALYPNPAKTRLNVQGIANDEVYKIYTLQGQLIKQGKTLHKQLEVEDLKPGLYLIQIGEKSILKFIKE